MEPPENRADPKDAEQADAESDDHDRSYRIAGSAQHCGENFDECPGEIEGNKVKEHLPGGGNDRRIFGQKVQKGLRGEHDQTAESDSDTEGENKALTDTELYPVHPLSAEVLPDKAGDGGAEGIADGPENTVDLRRHGPGGDDDRTERVDTDLDDHVGDTVHGVLEPGGDSETEHVAQVNALQLQLTKAQPIRLIRTDQTAGQKKHIDDLCGNCRDRDTGNAPMEKHHKHHIQDDVGDAADDHEEKGTE